MIPLPSPELIERYNRPTPRYTSYPPASEWTPAFDHAALDERLLAADQATGALSLYVHLPFCPEMCRFCGCNVIATRDRSRADEYLDVLEQEIRLWAEKLPRRREVQQLHLGGGTPTFLTPAQLERLVGMIDATFERLPGAELSVEVDPAITTPKHLETLGRLGFNRLSVGIQDLDGSVQAAIGRIQSAEQTELVIGAGRANGFTNVNVDLMYGLPFQTPLSVERTIGRVLDMLPDRLALFGYAHVPWAKPHQRLLPQAALPGSVARVELFALAARLLEEKGFQQIGLDHFARKMDPLARAQREGTLTRNFQGYSTQVPPDTIALGVSAISDIGGAFAQGKHRLGEWAESVRRGELPLERGWVRTNDDERRAAAIREVMCLLRFDVGPLTTQYGQAAQELFAEVQPGLEALEKDGLVTMRPGGFDVAPLGRIFLRNIAAVFDGYLGQTGRQQVFSKAV